MKKLLLISAAVILLAVNPALSQAGTLTITGSGFANLPATPPANWPSGVAYPAAQSPNGTKTFTISDADWQALITWAAAATVTPNAANPPAPTAAQILLNWIMIWANGTKAAVQQYNQIPATTPPPINMQ